MTPVELQDRGAPQPSVGGDGFVNSHGFFALILMSMFAVAIALSIVGLTTPSWLGFS